MLVFLLCITLVQKFQNLGKKIHSLWYVIIILLKILIINNNKNIFRTLLEATVEFFSKNKNWRVNLLVEFLIMNIIFKQILLKITVGHRHRWETQNSHKYEVAKAIKHLRAKFACWEYSCIFLVLNWSGFRKKIFYQHSITSYFNKLFLHVCWTIRIL